MCGAIEEETDTIRVFFVQLWVMLYQPEPLPEREGAFFCIWLLEGGKAIIGLLWGVPLLVLELKSLGSKGAGGFYPDRLGMWWA